MDKVQTAVYLIRHAHADNSNERLLTEEGREEAKKIGLYLRAFAPAAIFSSPSERAIQTAKIIADVAEIPGDVVSENNLYDTQLAAGVLSKFILSLVERFAGGQLVLISHLDTIQEILIDLGFEQDEIVNTLKMGQGYRIVFANLRAVECLKVNPAHVV